MNTTIEEKFRRLTENLRKLEKVMISFSGGVDSTFLLKAAHDALGDNAVAVTARSPSFPKRELACAAAFCEKEGVSHIIFDSTEFEIDGFTKNPENRCYLCKNALFARIWRIAKERGIAHVAEGSNADDAFDYRPGLAAVAEQGVKSPLREAGLTKQEIRVLSRKLDLPTWDKQSFACLLSRFPYGEELTPRRLEMIEKAEQFLLDEGFRQMRVRYHGTLARIEADAEGFTLAAAPGMREKIYAAFREIGFTYVALDLLGYRSGSMDETLKRKLK